MSEYNGRIDSVVGLSISDLIDVSNKLDVLGITTKELLEFLDRDKVQLFAEQQEKIKRLEADISRIAGIAAQY